MAGTLILATRGSVGQLGSKSKQARACAYGGGGRAAVARGSDGRHIAEQKRLQRRVGQVESRLRKEHLEAEGLWREEAARLKAHVAKLAEEAA